jgi:hypothetical protein
MRILDLSIIRYGRFYLGAEELQRRLKEELHYYHGFLAVNLLGFRGKEFWDYHKGRLEELGYSIMPFLLLKTAAIKALRYSLNPGHALRKLSKHLFVGREPVA